MVPLRIAIIGLGKIARDQHIPAIRKFSRFELAATVSRGSDGMANILNFRAHQDLLHSAHVDAVAICTPPGARYQIARDCIEAGLHILLEKPPSVTLGEIEDLACLAEMKGVTLFATWHARHNDAVDATAKLLAGHRIRSMRIIWHEDVRKWHPGQQWIWEPGGFGVFDPGINALSIVTKIMPGPLFVKAAALHYPENRQAPIAAELTLWSPVGDRLIPVSLDWRHSGAEQWDIRIEAMDGPMIELRDGGSRLFVEGEEKVSGWSSEYAGIYGRFLDLIDARQSDVDTRPLRLVADALLVARRFATDAFVD